MRVDGGAVDQPPPVDDADWIAISELARLRGVSKQAISKRVKALTTAGRLPARGEGRALRIHRPTFDEIAAISRDPAQELRNRHNHGGRLPLDSEAPSSAPIIAAEPVVRPSGATQTAYDSASTRDKLAMAALRELELAERRKELVPVADLEAAAIEIGTKMRQSISTLKTLSGKLYAAAHTGGEDAVHVLIVETVDEMLRQMAAEMTKLAACVADET